MQKVISSGSGYRVYKFKKEPVPVFETIIKNPNPFEIPVKKFQINIGQESDTMLLYANVNIVIVLNV
jgi:hypothetical protein